MRGRTAAIVLLAITLPAASAVADDAAPPKVLAGAVSLGSAVAACPSLGPAASAERFAKPAGCAADRDRWSDGVRSCGATRPIRNDDVIVLAGGGASVVVVLTGGSRGVGACPVGRATACQERKLWRPIAPGPATWPCPASPPCNVPAATVRDPWSCTPRSFAVRR